MKSINILSLINAKNNLSTSVFKLYLRNFEIIIKEDELKDLESLITEIQKDSPELLILDGFYVGYRINQIGKEFDLLRIGESNIVNIELKRENTGEKIKKQLIKNKYYLSFLKKNVFNFT